MTTPHRDQPSLHECQVKLRELAGKVGQGVLELRKAREKWADLIENHEKAVADCDRILSTAIEVAREAAKKVPREDGKRQTQEDITAKVNAAVADEQYNLTVEKSVVAHAKRLGDAEIRYLEGLNDAAEHERAIWNALLRSVMQEMSLAGVPDPNPRQQRRYA